MCNPTRKRLNSDKGTNDLANFFTLSREIYRHKTGAEVRTFDENKESNEINIRVQPRKSSNFNVAPMALIAERVVSAHIWNHLQSRACLV